jgi:hypothetical protein
MLKDITKNACVKANKHFTHFRGIRDENKIITTP